MVLHIIEEKAKMLGIRVEWSDELDQYTPPAASTKYNCIVMNSNWHDKKEIPFQLAHEISHILNHDNCIAFYHASYSSKERMEREANLGAIQLLLPIFRDMGYENNPVTFMKAFNIPGYLLDNVIKIMKKYK